MNSNRKIIFFIFELTFISSSYLFAQNVKQGAAVSGIYMCSQDYTQDKLSYSFDCNKSGKIKLNDFISSKYIYVTVAGKQSRFNKDSIFGYRNCKNETYRFYKKHDEEFLILESKGIVVYQSNTGVSSNNGKIIQVKSMYFFSRTENSEILPLTMANLKLAFPDNIKFHDLLDGEFGNGEPLSAYSDSEGTYKINYLFNKSNK